MGVTAAVVSAGVGVVGGLIQANQQKQKQKGEIAAINRSLSASIAATPPIPSVAQANTQAAQNAAVAAARQRRAAAGAGGSSSGTGILTNPQGAGQAVTARKQLIGL